MRILLAAILSFCLIFSGFSSGGISEGENFYEDEQNLINFAIFDENDVYITERSGVNLGDIIIDKFFNQYEIFLIDEVNALAKAKFIKKLEVPNIRRKNVENVANQIPNKTLGFYSTHNDESYILGDGTESVYGAGGIHDIAGLLAYNIQQRGLGVIHDQTLHIPHNSSAYARSRVTASGLLNSGADAIFDIHRDGTSRNFYLTSVNGRELSKVRIVVGQANPNKEANLQLALYISSVAQSLYPWMIADIYYGSGKYNQDLSNKALLFEMGCHLIEKEYVERTVPYLADVLYTTLYETTVNQENGDLTIGGVEQENEQIIDDVIENFSQSKTPSWLIYSVGSLAIILIIYIFLPKKRKKSD